MSQRGGWRLVRDQVALFRAASASGPDNPGSVRSDDQSRALFKRAAELAGSEIDDQAARDELRQLAGSRRKTLERAGKASRLGRRHLEAGERANRVHRLLYAALHDEPVAPADPEVLAQIAGIGEAFRNRQTQAEVWGRLLDSQPRLRALLQQARSGRFGENFDEITLTAEQRSDPGLRQREYDSANGPLELAVELKRVIGPQAETSDLIAGSERAYGLAYVRLQDERPLPEDVL